MRKGEENSRAVRDNSEPPHVKEYDRGKKVMMGEETFEKYRQLLRLIRRISPADKQLTFEQTLRLAERYFEIYQRFLASKAMISAFEVRVGTKEILGAIQNRPDGVRELRYRGAMPDDAVIQVWRSADRQFDEVPLLFQDIEGILHEGVSRTELYPNGQSITLRVFKEQNNEVRVNLALALWKKISVDDTAYISEKKDAEARSNKPKAKAKAAYQRMREFIDGSGHEIPASIYATGQTSTPWMRGVSMLLITVVCLISTLGAYAPIKQGVLQRPRDQARPVKASTPSERKASSGPKADMLWMPGEDNPQMTEVVPASPPTVNRGVIARVRVRNEKNSSTNSAASASTATASPDTAAATSADVKETPSSSAVITNWDRDCILKLATLTQVYVENPNDSTLDQASIARIREDFSKALEQQGITVLDAGVKGQPANGIGIIRLRFEPNKESKGAVFAELRDMEGQYIWDDKAGCKTLAGADLNTILGDASHRLGTIMVFAIQQAQRNVGGRTTASD